MTTVTITIVPGDGIGPDITGVISRLLDAPSCSFIFLYKKHLAGGGGIGRRPDRGLGYDAQRLHRRGHIKVIEDLIKCRPIKQAQSLSK